MEPFASGRPTRVLCQWLGEAVDAERPSTLLATYIVSSSNEASRRKNESITLPRARTDANICWVVTDDSPVPGKDISSPLQPS